MPISQEYPGSKIHWRSGGSLASTGDPDEGFYYELIKQALAETRNTVSEKYRRGDRDIEGRHRAYYMEAMANFNRRNAFLTAHDSLLMPIEITNRGSDGKTYSVYLDNIDFFTNKATLDAYIIIETPFEGQKLVFEAQGVEFTPKGPVVNPLKVDLANDVWVRINNNARLKILAGENTYVAVDCGGFAGIGIEADVELCRNIVLPYDPVTDSILPEPQRVSGHFQVVMPSFSEFYVEMDLDPFAIPGYEDIKWLINGVVLDMSETLSPVGAPPVGYETPLAGSGGFSPAWKGFYVDSLIVLLPRHFSSDSTPISVGVQDLVIDNMGVSASATVDNILSLAAGSAGGWAFSIEHFELTVVMNQFENLSLTGLIHIPVLRDKNNESGTLSPDDCILYEARVDPGNLYSFTLEPFAAQYAVDIWKAGQVVIDPSSSVQMLYQNGDFTLKATLSGQVIVDGQLSPHVGVTVPTISFQGVEVSNKAPYFSPGIWNFPNQIGAKFAGFGLTFHNIGMVKTANDEPALAFTALIHITDDTTRIKASGGFKIVGELADDNGRQRWKYKTFSVNEINISGSFPGVRSLQGQALFYENDSIYGTGFRGAIGAEFELMDASIQVVAQFGRMPADDYKYFFLDAMFCGNVPMAGALNLKGLGGGVYYRMTRPDSAFSLPACDGLPIPTEIGTSISGIKYTPDKNSGLGFKLTVAVALATAERAFNANATFEVKFNSTGGLDRMWLYGNGKFMADLNMSGLPTLPANNGKPNNGAALSAAVNLTVAFGPHPSFTGTLNVYANIGGVLRGAGANDLVTNASIKFAPGSWYIKIGSPSTPAGMLFTLPVFGNVGQSNSYFQIGTETEGIPPLPADIAALTGANVTGLTPVSPGLREPEVTQGKGFSFGTFIQVGTAKPFTFLIFTAGVKVKLGFDISVLDYGPNTVCSGSTEPIGVNGWYAEGQIYAGIEASVGIKVKIFGQQKQFNILSVAAAAAMQARLPNPFWAQASFGFQYNVLGGLVKGSGNFQLEIGEKCIIMGQDDPFKEVPIILNTIPYHDQENVSVGTSPRVTFNFPIGSSFEFEDLNGNGTQYKITLDYAKLKWNDQTEIACTQKWSEGNRLLTLEPSFFLPGNAPFTLTVKVHVDSNGVTVDHEERIVHFTTGEGMKEIPKSNIAGSYPFDGQYNYYKLQINGNKGYIQLKKAQPDFFFDDNDDPYIKVVRFRRPGGICHSVPLNLNPATFLQKRIEFDVPTDFLEHGAVYELQVLDFPKSDPNWGNGYSGAAPCLCNNCATPPAPPTGGGNGGGTSGSGQSASAGGNTAIGGEGVPGPPPASTIPTERVLYSAYFRVSLYNTFLDKLDALASNISSKPGHTADFIETEALPEFDMPFDIGELFDEYELQGGVQLKTVIDCPTCSDPTWFAASKKSFIYSGFPDQYTGIGMNILGGNILPYPNFGQLPTTAAYISSGSLRPVVTKQNYLSGTFPATYVDTVQKIHFFGQKLMDDYYSRLVLEAEEYKDLHLAAMLAAWDCPNDFFLDYCAEINCGIPIQYYSFAVRNLYYNCSPGGAASVSYPIDFQYRMPGWFGSNGQQLSNGYMIELKP